jgi:hypothetical protein
MRDYLAILFFWIVALHIGYTQNLSIYPVLGFKTTHDANDPGFLPINSKERIVNFAQIGFDLSVSGVPLLLKARQDIFFRFHRFNNLPSTMINLSVRGTRQIRTCSSLLLAYAYKNNHFEVGWYRDLYDNQDRFFIGQVDNDIVITGFVIGYTKRFDWFNLSFRHRFAVNEPDALWGFENFEVVASTYLWNPNRKEKINKSKWDLDLSIGLRNYFSESSLTLPYEQQPLIKLAPTLELELFIDDFILPIGLFAQKDWYVGLNGGSPVRFINDYVSTTSVGVKYKTHINGDEMLVGLSYSYLTDQGKTILIAPTSVEELLEMQKYLNYQEKGIGLEFEYEFAKYTYFSLRNIFVLDSIDNVGFFDFNRFNIGIKYKIID